MNGAEAIVRTLLRAGISTCFANPGTSEMHFVAALDRVPGMRCILGLSESVVTGAADGYARMAERPAATLLHCGPGLANGLANLHNARRAQTSMVNLVGDQATYHRPLDAPLTAATEEWARPVSAWVRTAKRAQDVGQDVAEGVRAALAPPGGIATLILPSDVCWDEGGSIGEPFPGPPPARASEDAVASAARVLRSGRRSALLLGNPALTAAHLELAARVRGSTGAMVLSPTAVRRIERGCGRHPVTRIPYAIEQAVEFLAGVENVILVGSAPPVSFFAYPGKPQTPLPAGTQIHVLAEAGQDCLDVLQRLAEQLATPAVSAPVVERVRSTGTGPITPPAIGNALAALLPEDAIVVDESISFGRSFFSAMEGAVRHDWLSLTGGAIGDGPPMAAGAAMACPGRRVINLQADGSALYSLQALWTQAREKLNVTTVIFSNRKYAILLNELRNVGANPGRTALDILDIGNPGIDWVKIAAGFGVDGASASSVEDFADLFRRANRSEGPFLIELHIT